MSCEDLPPPSYSEQEFDRKISTVLDASLTVPQPPVIQPDEEAWEQWDESAFETAARATLSTSPSWSNQAREGGLSQHVGNIGTRSIMPANIEPLRIHKKSGPVGKSNLPKTRHGECRGEIIDEVTYCSQPGVRASTSSQPGLNGVDYTTPEPTSQTIHRTVSVLEEHEFTSPPPPFSPAELNSDGTPIVIMSYNPSMSEGGGPPPSPLTPPLLSIHPLPDHRPRPTQFQPHPLLPQQPIIFHDDSAPHRRIPHHSLPASPRSPNNQLRKHPGASSGLNFLQASRVPRMSFDPLIAYHKQDGSSLPLTPAQCAHTELHMQSFSANAFYNSAVSAHLPHSRSSSAVSGHGNTYQPSSGHYSGIEQIRQPNFLAPQHAALSVDPVVRMNRECQNPMSHAAPRRSAYIHR